MCAFDGRSFVYFHTTYALLVIDFCRDFCFLLFCMCMQFDSHSFVYFNTTYSLLVIDF